MLWFWCGISVEFSLVCVLFVYRWSNSHQTDSAVRRKTTTRIAEAAAVRKAKKAIIDPVAFKSEKSICSVFMLLVNDISHSMVLRLASVHRLGLSGRPRAMGRSSMLITSNKSHLNKGTHFKAANPTLTECHLNDRRDSSPISLFFFFSHCAKSFLRTDCRVYVDRTQQRHSMLTATALARERERGCFCLKFLYFSVFILLWQKRWTHCGTAYKFGSVQI